MESERRRAPPNIVIRSCCIAEAVGAIGGMGGDEELHDRRGQDSDFDVEQPDLKLDLARLAVLLHQVRVNSRRRAGWPTAEQLQTNRRPGT